MMLRVSLLVSLLLLAASFAGASVFGESLPVQTLLSHAYIVYSVAFSPDGNLIASGSDDNNIMLWDVATGEEVRIFTGHTAPVTSVAFSPDGKALASGSWDNTVKLWDVATGAEVRTLKGNNIADTAHEYFSCIAFSPDGTLVAAGSWDNTVTLWEISTGKEARTLRIHTAGVNSVAFSPDGKSLASGSEDSSVRLWNVATGAIARTFTGTNSSVTSVAFSPDGKFLASGLADNTVRLWNVATGAGTRTLTGHSDRVTSVAFSPDGRFLAAGSNDKTIRFWDVTMGAEVRNLEGHSGAVTSVAISSDGRLVASGAFDGTVTLWEVARVAEATLGPTAAPLPSAPNALTLATAAQTGAMHLSLGAEFIGGVPALLCNLKGDSFGGEATATVRFLNIQGSVDLSIILYGLLGKWYFPIEGVPISPFLGVGVAGASMNASALGQSASAGALALDFAGGVEVSGRTFGVPLVFSFGPEYRYVLTAWGISLSDLERMAVLAGAIIWQISLRYEF